MESTNLHLNIDHVGSSGIILSSEQKAALQTSLTILQNNQQFNTVYFWGKILGIKDDYFIAQGVSENELGDRRTLYRYSIKKLLVVIIVTVLLIKHDILIM